jgi:hypothetical protein
MSPAKLFVTAWMTGALTLVACASGAQSVDPQPPRREEPIQSASAETPAGRYRYAVATSECGCCGQVYVAIYFLRARSSQLPPRDGSYIKVTLSFGEPWLSPHEPTIQWKSSGAAFCLDENCTDRTAGTIDYGELNLKLGKGVDGLLDLRFSPTIIVRKQFRAGWRRARSICE